ncbi:T9SS type A sorting domain-containing protein [Cryomorpha ignava]|uniref:T9SS type A sorting domain-containing protein n=1 Tax=Cryomorpha ignava TaxID=101383 RepID=A0A7K3WQG4_9FLAO|nr:T9SS type A sorting domain-containing protein [Cryomorpha ignava]NEN23122.1 T9SS type A sorting domain-containing protein [Cryomorpha ignava]
MRILAIVCLTLISQGAYSQISFKKTYGDIGKGDYGEGITQLSNGDYISCGNQVYQDTLANYVGDAVIRRMDVNGNELWSINYSDPNSAYQDLSFYSIIKTMDGNLVIAGVSDYGFQNDYKDAYLAKINTDGDILWQHNYGGSFAQGLVKVVETSEGGLLSVGANHTATSANSQALYAIKTDAFGNVEWVYTHPDGLHPSIRHQAYSVAETPDGNYIISGKVTSTISTPEGIYAVALDNTGNLLWNNTYDYFGGQGRVVFIKNNGNILVCGWYAPNWIARPLIIELDANGVFLNDYEFNYDNTIREWAYSYYKDDFDVVTMLSFDIESNYRIIQIDNAFDIVWDRFITYDSGTAAEGHHIKKTNDNGFICTGTSIIQGDIQAVAFKVDENGVLSTPHLSNQLNQINIFPNPASDLLHISINRDAKVLRITLLDLNGKRIKQFELFERQLDISGISGGQYFLKVEFDNSVVTEKIIIK